MGEEWALKDRSTDLPSLPHPMGPESRFRLHLEIQFSVPKLAAYRK
jgi:hypothetical protein